MAKLAFKDTVSDATKIIGDIKARKFSPIYLLMGEDPYYVDAICGLISSTVLNEMEREFNQVQVYGKDVSGGEVALQCRRFPMMSQWQVVIVRDAQNVSKIEELNAYCATPLESTILVLCFNYKSLDKRSAFYKTISKRATILETVSPKDTEINSFIETIVAKNGTTIEPKAVAMVAENVGGNLKRIAQEFEKLFTRVGIKPITAQDIEDNFGISKEYNAFELNKALSVRDFTRALKIADFFENNPKENPFIGTVAILFSHFQRIVAVGIMLWQAKKEGKSTPSNADIASLLGISPYFVGEYLQAVKAYPTAKSFAIIGLLRQYDMRAKGIGAGTADDTKLLSELILRIATI